MGLHRLMRVVGLVFSKHLAPCYCFFDLATHGRPIYAISSPPYACLYSQMVVDVKSLQGIGNDDAIALEEYAIVNCEFFSEVPVISDGCGNQFCYVAPSNRYDVVYITRYCSLSPETVLSFHW